MIIKKILLASLTYSQIWLIPRWTIAYEAMSQNLRKITLLPSYELFKNNYMYSYVQGLVCGRLDHSPFTRQKNMLFFKSLHSSFVKQSQVVFAN
jgi:hypothetical protein